MVSLPKLTSCFCGCSLQQGTIIIGAISLLVSVFGMLGCLGMMLDSSALVKPQIKAYLNETVPGWNEDMDASVNGMGECVPGMGE